MFRQIQKYVSAPVSVGMESNPVTNPQTGFVERTKRSCAAPLPDSKMFDPTSCVKAGVNLEQVRSNVMGVFPESVPPVAAVVTDAVPSIGAGDSEDA